MVRRSVGLVRRVVRRLMEPLGRRKTKMKGKGRRKPLRRKAITRRRRKVQEMRETRANRTYGLYSTLTHLDIMDLTNKSKSKILVTAMPPSPRQLRPPPRLKRLKFRLDRTPDSTYSMAKSARPT